MQIAYVSTDRRTIAFIMQATQATEQTARRLDSLNQAAILSGLRQRRRPRAHSYHRRQRVTRVTTLNRARHATGTRLTNCLQPVYATKNRKYKVKWRDANEKPTWQNASDVSPALIRDFHIHRTLTGRKRRRRQLSYNVDEGQRMVL
jgi:hypothetical protein